MKKNHYTSMVLCLLFCVTADLFCADNHEQEAAKKGEPQRLASRGVSALLQSTSSSSGKEDEKDMHAERNVPSNGSGSEAVHSMPLHSMTPPFTALGSSRIKRREENDVDRSVLELVDRFSSDALALHSAFAHVLEEQHRQRCLISNLQVRVRAQEKSLERTEIVVNHIADNACDASYCRQYNRELITKRVEEVRNTLHLETYHIRKRIGSLEDNIRQMEELLRDVELRTERIETEQRLSGRESSSGSSSSQQSRQSKREPIKGRLIASSSSGSDPDMSPFNLASKETLEEAQPPLYLDAEPLTQKLFEEAGDTAV